MPRQRMCLSALIALAMGVSTVACTQGTGGIDDAAEPGSAPADATVGAAAPNDGTAPASAGATPVGAEPSEVADEDDVVAGSTLAPVSEPTMDPALEAFYAEFSLPEKGDPGAEVMLYEFSDYI